MTPQSFPSTEGGETDAHRARPAILVGRPIEPLEGGAHTGASPALELVPITLREARAFVAQHHRHNQPVRGWKIGVGLRDDAGELRGVAILARPVSRHVQDGGRTIEIVRVATLGDRNANSRLYGACCRAAKALGYLEAVTYTLEEESGVSLRAAGFVEDDGDFGAGRKTWASPSRPRYDENLLGETIAPRGAKRRWRRRL